jgi:hypothetical protein
MPWTLQADLKAAPAAFDARAAICPAPLPGSARLPDGRHRGDQPAKARIRMGDRLLQA